MKIQLHMLKKLCLKIHFKNHVSDRFWVLAAFFIIVTVIVILHYPLAASGIALNIPKLDTFW